MKDPARVSLAHSGQVPPGSGTPTSFFSSPGKQGWQRCPIGSADLTVLQRCRTIAFPLLGSGVRTWKCCRAVFVKGLGGPLFFPGIPVEESLKLFGNSPRQKVRPFFRPISILFFSFLSFSFFADITRFGENLAVGRPLFPLFFFRGMPTTSIPFFFSLASRPLHALFLNGPKNFHVSFGDLSPSLFFFSPQTEYQVGRAVLRFLLNASFCISSMLLAGTLRGFSSVYVGGCGSLASFSILWALPVFPSPREGSFPPHSLFFLSAISTPVIHRDRQASPVFFFLNSSFFFPLHECSNGPFGPPAPTDGAPFFFFPRRPLPVPPFSSLLWQ